MRNYRSRVLEIIMLITFRAQRVKRALIRHHCPNQELATALAQRMLWLPCLDREKPVGRAKVFIWRKVGRDRGLTLPSPKGNPTRRVIFLSPPQRPLCVVGRLGRAKKERARGTMGRGKREERLPRLFPLPIVPRALSIFFDYCYFYRDTQGEPLGRRGSSP